MPGSASRSAWLAVLMSTRAGLAAGLASPAGLVAAGLSAGVCARAGLGGTIRARGGGGGDAADETREGVANTVRGGHAVTTIAGGANFNGRRGRNEIFMRRSLSIQGLGQSSDLTASTTSAAWPLTLTLGQWCLTLPSLPMTTVDRMMPFIFLPYMTLSPQAP